MASLLIRDIDEETKRALTLSAARNGRSQQAEALAILRTQLLSEPKSWLQLIRDRAAEVDGMEFHLAERPPSKI